MTWKSPFARTRAQEINWQYHTIPIPKPCIASNILRQQLDWDFSAILCDNWNFAVQSFLANVSNWFTSTLLCNPLATQWARHGHSRTSSSSASRSSSLTSFAEDRGWQSDREYLWRKNLMFLNAPRKNKTVATCCNMLQLCLQRSIITFSCKANQTCCVTLSFAAVSLLFSCRRLVAVCSRS